MTLIESVFLNTMFVLVLSKILSLKFDRNNLLSLKVMFLLPIESQWVFGILYVWRGGLGYFLNGAFKT